MLGLNKQQTGIVLGLICISFGFSSIFTPWLHNNYKLENADYDSYFYLYKSYTDITFLNGSRTSQTKSLYASYNLRCIYLSRKDCFIAKSNYQSASATLAFIVTSIAFAIIYCAMSVFSYRNRILDAFILFYIQGSLTIGIIIFPLSVFRYIEGIPNMYSWYTGFWLLLIDALLSMWCLISIVSMD